MTDDTGRLPDDIDPTKPSVARVYDFYLGGSHNFEADREFGRRAIETFPDGPQVVRANREFLRRAVVHACAQGVTQFLDLGSGIPTVGNVHEVAAAAAPGARVVYVDHDPVAVAHGSALLESNPHAVSVLGDIRRPDTVLDVVRATGLLDLDRPVAVMLVFVLHFVHDDEHPRELIATYMSALAPGSLLALSHGRDDVPSPMLEAAKLYNDPGSPGYMRLRSRHEVAALFGGLTMVEPGLVVLPRWHPELTGTTVPDDVDDDYPGLAGMARLDGPGPAA